MKVVLLEGSPAVPSRVGVLLNTIAARVQAHGHQAAVIELQDLHLPVNNPVYHKHPDRHPEQSVRDFVALIQGADAVVLGTPLYHGAYSGLLKGALDHLDDDALSGKTVGVVSNATGARSAAAAAAALVPVARALKGSVCNCTIGTCKEDYGEKDGIFQIIDQGILDRIERFTLELIGN